MNTDVDLGRIQVLLRARSKALFGKLYRLEVVATVGATDDPIWSRLIAQSLRLAENQVSVELKVLAEVGALRAFPSVHDRRKLYLRVPHPIWDFGRDLVEDTIIDAYPDEHRQAIATWFEALAIAEPQPVPTEPR